MHTFTKIAVTALALISFASAASAQMSPTDRIREKGWELEIRTGVNLGGTAPMPMPAEVREIKEYNPKLNGILELSVYKWFIPHGGFGFVTGVRLEQKGMETVARVKNYHMAMTQQGAVMEGNWTGMVRSSYYGSSVTVPLLLAYNFHDRGRVSAGVYAGYILDGDFSGDVYDGYFRKGSPVGEKIVFSNEDRTPYSFKDAIRPYEVGLQIGGSVKIYHNFNLFADLKCSFTNIFKSDFTAVSFPMYPIYIGTGFSHLF